MMTLIQVAPSVQAFVDVDARSVQLVVGGDEPCMRFRFFVGDICDSQRFPQCVEFLLRGYGKLVLRFEGRWWPAHLQLFESQLRGMGVAVPELGASAPGPAAEA